MWIWDGLTEEFAPKWQGVSEPSNESNYGLEVHKINLAMSWMNENKQLKAENRQKNALWFSHD